MSWSAQNLTDPLYQVKFLNVPDIVGDWMSEHGGLAGKNILEFGCGEGTMALGMALRKNPRRVVGVEILDIYQQCLSLASKNIALDALPGNLELQQITPGANLSPFGSFDFVYSWSVFEHVSQDLLARAFASIRSVLRNGGMFFLQIAPLYYSAYGSHLGPWVSEPWAHLSMQHDQLHQRLLRAPATPSDVRSQWSVYIPLEADMQTERDALWQSFTSLNKVTAAQLYQLASEAGFEIVRDYRTRDEVPVPDWLAEIYHPDVLTTQQIVLLMRHADLT